MKKVLLTAIPMAVAVCSVNAQADGLPANPTPGKCYVKCITPDEFKEVEETYVASPAYKKLTVVPATFRTVEERVMVKEPSKKFIYVPAVYEAVQVDYVSKESYKTLSVTPASFGTDSKSFESYPATSGWEYKADPNCKSPNPNDCIVACFREYPAKYSSVQVKTLVRDASVNEVTVPEQKSSYRKMVVKSPARVEEVEVPAEYATIRKVVVDRPARVEEITVPAETRSYKKKPF